MIYAEWQVGQLLWSMLWFTMFFLWIWVVVTVFADIFRSREIGGFAKAVWTLFVVFLPILGVLGYLIVHGGTIGDRPVEEVR